MAQIHPTALVEKGAELGEGVVIGPYCMVGGAVKLGRNVRLTSHAVVEGVTEIGDDCEIHAFANIGGPPQHLAHKGEPTRLVVGPRNIIREHVTMHTGTATGRGVTTVGSDGLHMVGAHIAHDCIVGDHVVLAKGATLGGHVVMGDYVFMGGLAAVTKDVIPYGSVWGNHAHLEGLNLVGLRRRGFPRETISAMRSAYRMLMADEGTFQERLEDTARTFGEVSEVMEIVDFIRSEANRPLCLPEREV